MTATEQTKKIGQKGFIRYNNLHFVVEVLDVKTSYGQERYLITPYSGYGTAWMSNVNFNNFSNLELENDIASECMYDHDHSKNKGRDCEWHN